MIWEYASLDKLENHIDACKADIRMRRASAITGEMEQAVEVESDDLVEILEAARDLLFEYRDPRDVEQLKRLRVDGVFIENYFYLSRPVNSFRIVYFRDILRDQVTVSFVYNVNYSRLVPFREMLTLVKIDDER